jgi:hypothetical protein
MCGEVRITLVITWHIHCFAVWNALAPVTYACLHTRMQICVGLSQESQESGA